MSDEDIIRIAKKLDKIAAGVKPEDGAIDLIKKLKNMTVSVQILQKTRVGMTINDIRKKTTDQELASLSKSLIKSWKKLLDGGSSSSGGNASGAGGDGATKESSKPDQSQSLSRQSSNVPSASGDEYRQKCTNMILNSLKIEELPEGTLDPEELAIKIELKLFEIHKGTGDKYKAQLRSRVFNLRDKKNPELRDNVLTGVISPDTFATMTSEEMASDAVKELRNKFTKECIDEHQISQEGGTATDMFKCGRCKKNNCTYTQAQTRSADEPMTTFVFCRECGNRWKFC